MSEDKETVDDELKRLEDALNDLLKKRPEHCHDTGGFIGVHRNTPAFWQKVEDIEERIKELKEHNDSP